MRDLSENELEAVSGSGLGRAIVMVATALFGIFAPSKTSKDRNE